MVRFQNGTMADCSKDELTHMNMYKNCYPGLHPTVDSGDATAPGTPPLPPPHKKRPAPRGSVALAPQKTARKSAGATPLVAASSSASSSAGSVATEVVTDHQMTAVKAEIFQVKAEIASAEAGGLVDVVADDCVKVEILD